MYISDFQDFNAGRVESGEDPYASPRNTAAGSVRQLDSRVTASTKLDVLVYDVLAVEGQTFRSDTEGVEAIRQWGFKLPERIELAGSVEEILEYHAGFGADRDQLDFEIDGIVIKLDDSSMRSAVGATSHHPRWALAFKFEPRQGITRIDKIDINVGRTGVLTPVAILRPVVVGGVTVSRASLHNREDLKRKDLRESTAEVPGESLLALLRHAVPRPGSGPGRRCEGQGDRASRDAGNLVVRFVPDGSRGGDRVGRHRPCSCYLSVADWSDSRRPWPRTLARRRSRDGSHHRGRPG